MPRPHPQYCCRGAMKRLYTRDRVSKQYVPIGWWCPHCKAVKPDRGKELVGQFLDP